MDVWIEKYRPKTLNDIVGQSSVVETLEHYVETKNIPNLIFYGKRGVGKTSAIHSMCRDLYGEDYKKFVLELIRSIKTKN